MPEKGKFLKRLNRFTVLVEIEKKKYKAYLSNSGRLEEVLIKGNLCLLERKSRGKLPYKLLAVRRNNIWVSVDAHLVNKFFLELFENNKVPFLKGYKLLSKEKKIEKGRIDFVFATRNKIAFLEVKSCTLVENGIAMFPDAPTERGKRHIEFLIKKKKEGYESFLVFVVQREDAVDFAPNSFTHFEFSKRFYEALLQGVESYLIISSFDPEIKKLHKIKIKKLDPFKCLLNEYHLYRYPEVEIKILKKSKEGISLKFEGETCHHCSFEENFEDFIYFAKDRGFDIKVLDKKFLTRKVLALVSL